LKGKVEAEKRATELAEIRALTEAEARKKVEALLEQLRDKNKVVRDKNTVVEGLLKSQKAMKAWRWKEAGEILKAILKLEPDSYRIREPLAQVQFILKQSCCIEEYRWLASQHALDTDDSKRIRWEFQLKAMLALLDLPLVNADGKLVDAVTKLEIITDIAKDFTEEPYTSVGWILQQDAQIEVLKANGKAGKAGLLQSRLKGRVMDLYEKRLDSALVKYIVAVHLEPYYLNRIHTIKLLDAVAEDTDDFLPAFIARQRNCLFVISEFGTDYEWAEELLRSAQKDLLKLRKRLPCTTEIDVAYVDCLVTMTQMHVFRDEHRVMINEAHEKALSYLKLRGTERYLKKAYLIELTIAYAFAAKYRWKKANHRTGADFLKEEGVHALQKAQEYGFESSDEHPETHNTKRVRLITSWLQAG